MKQSLGAKSILYPNPILCVATYDKEGKANVMTAAWGGICCSSPPAVSVSLRKATYSYGNIVERKAFTINVPSEKYVKEVDYFGIATGAKEDKFARTGLTPVPSELVDAPYIDEFPMIIECKLIHTIEIGLHTQFIGEIIDIKVDQEVIGEKGLPSIEKLKPFLFAAPERAYHGIGKHLGQAFSIGKELMD
ncbi:MAG: flavin reductase family protein [Proteobacteria bacterium]|nr:flavin reductase family protein [Pseudomonadota bacterium]MBU1708639.1 flavin reductase family protein [Pseudomonadota bacterium]